MPVGRGEKSRVKKRTKHLARRRPQLEGGSCDNIEFLRNSSTLKVSAEMVVATEGFFFPEDEEWLQSLSFSKFYEMTISSLYKV